MEFACLPKAPQELSSGQALASQELSSRSASKSTIKKQQGYQFTLEPQPLIIGFHSPLLLFR